MTTYVTKDGDTVDQVVYKYYGYTAKAVEQVYAANPGLADMGPVLPHGVRIELPALAPQVTETGPRLWS